MPCLALFIIGPLLSRLVGSLHGIDGGDEVSLLLSASPALGLALGLIGVIVAIAYGGIAARMLGERTGTLSGGLLLAWVAWYTGNLALVLRLHGSSTGLIMLAVEAAIVGTIALVGIALIAHLAPEHKNGVIRAEAKSLLKVPALAGMAAGTVAAIAVGWLVAFDGLRGQALMAAVAGGIAAAIASRLVAQSLGHDSPPKLLPFISILLAAILSPLIGMYNPGGGELAAAQIDGSLPGVLMIQPLDWAAAMLLGVPIGIGWTSAMVEKAAESKPAAARSHG